ncbi:MAG: type VI secretion system protein TssL [Ideonella sp. MAG2]|nr:MAG: type VI secretion system protein TssL [Ideonella sp. MAG2]
MNTLDHPMESSWASGDAGDLSHLGVVSTQTSALHFEPGPNYDERLARVREAQQHGGNPLLEAASVLLRALAEMPQRLNEAGLLGLHELLSRELQTFTRLCEQVNLRRDHLLVARYALCTALDEAINLSPTAGGAQESTGLWSTVALLNHFHGESHGGRKVFLIIGRLASSVDEHLDVLELMHHLLSLGFMGDYRVQAEGRRHLETIRHRLFTLVSGKRPVVPRELSVRWRGEGQGKLRLLRSVPVWVSACLLGLTLFGLFAWHKYHLSQRGAVLQERIEALQSVPAPVAAPRAQLLTLADLLAPEIQAQKVQVLDAPGRSLVVFKGDGMFSGGLATLSPATRAILSRIGEAINDVPGEVRIVGHTDNVALSSGQFKNNQALSEARALAVKAQLETHGVDPRRMIVSGRGEQAPVASNATPAGRARNRRVEIEVVTGQATAAPAAASASAATAGEAPASAPHTSSVKL